MAAAVGTQTQFKGALRDVEQLQEQLLPGIPNDITLNHITRQLPWTGTHILPSIGSAWQQAIHSREVHAARARSHSVETLVVVKIENSESMNFIALYSMRDNSFYFLPSIPGVDEGIPFGCQCVSLDGRIYILGGKTRRQLSSFVGSAKVYVLDLVWRRKWEQLADMGQPRFDFGCGVLDGKIYVFGGIAFGKGITGSEVYDPKVNSWSPILPMLSPGCSHQVRLVGGELFLYDGLSVYTDSALDLELVDSFRVEVYNPVRNEWRKVRTIRRMDGTSTGKIMIKASEIFYVIPEKEKRMFMANEKFYVITRVAIHQYNTDEQTWKLVHCFSSRAFKTATVQFYGVLAANGELLIAIGRLNTRPSLLRSKGFGGENKLIVWEEVDSYLAFGYAPLMCLAQV